MADNKSPKPLDTTLQHDHNEKRFSIFGLESDNLHLGALFSLTGLRAAIALAAGILLMYFTARSDQRGYLMFFGVISLGAGYAYYKDETTNGRLKLTTFGIAGSLAIIGFLRVVFFSSLISAMAALVAIALIYNFINGKRVKEELGLSIGPSNSLLLAAVSGLVVAWPLALLQLGIGLVALVIIFTALAVLRHCLDTGNQDINMSKAYRSIRSWIKGRKISQDDRQALHNSLFFEGRGTRIEIDRFLMFMALSAIIATIAVIAESPAVVIGAMLIAPLMTPLMSTTIALFMGWPKRLRQSAAITFAGVLLTIVVSMLASLMVPGDINVNTNSEMLPRISPTLLDLWVALAAGAAGSLALSRQDRFTSISGAAVAIALVPPLAASGIALQQAEWVAAYGAFLLFLTNAVAIVLISGVIFVLTGVVPVTMLGRSQSRMGVAIMALQIAGLMTFAGLMINGQTATISLLERDRVRGVVTEWLQDYPQIELDSLRLEGDQLDIRLSGDDDLPSLDDLGIMLREEDLAEDLSIDMKWTPAVRQTLTP